MVNYPHKWTPAPGVDQDTTDRVYEEMCAKWKTVRRDDMIEVKSSGNGMGCGTVLFFIFLVLKLCHVIDWSWWWVTAPLWGIFALVGVTFLVVLIFQALIKR